MAVLELYIGVIFILGAFSCLNLCIILLKTSICLLCLHF